MNYVNLLIQVLSYLVSFALYFQKPYKALKLFNLFLMVTVIVEDIYKRMPIARPMSNERQAIISKLLCKCHFSILLQLFLLWIIAVGMGLFVIVLAVLVSYMKSNIITVSFVQ